MPLDYPWPFLSPVFQPESLVHLCMSISPRNISDSPCLDWCSPPLSSQSTNCINHPSGPWASVYYKLTFSHVHTAETTRTPCGSSQIHSTGSVYAPLALMCFFFPRVPYRRLSHGGLALAPWSRPVHASREPDLPGITHRVTSSSSDLEQGSSLRWQKPHQLF